MSAHQISSSYSSQKKKMYDRFIPHSVARTLFNSDRKNKKNGQYQELLGQQLFDQHVVPKILKFGD